MKVTRTSFISGITRTLDLNITEEEADKFRKGALIQNAFPNLSADEREFILTGITKEEWDKTFKDEDEPL